MKKVYKLVFAFTLMLTSFSRTSASDLPKPGTPEYDLAKKQGLLSNVLPLQSHAASPFKGINTNTVSLTSVSSSCGCLLPIDSTFLLVPFAIGSLPYYGNDDGSSGIINLPFDFCYYGQTVNSLYINNNGNISFGNPYGTFTSSAFPNSGFNMIAPFWGDVDTRGAQPVVSYDSLSGTWDTLQAGTSYTGLVYYKVTPSALIVRWDSVGYFSAQADKRNTFQLIITDGNDPLVPGGNNVAFCYGDMQWTTGAASGGFNGFGGTPATVGINKGDGINYFQVGRFDHDSSDYDGPYLFNDGVSFLDNSTYFFTTCTSSNNIPPIALNDVCDTISIGPLDTSLIVLRYIGPEPNQVVSAQVLSVNPNISVLSNVPGNPCVVTLQVNGSSGTNPLSQITVLATDNAPSPASTTQTTTVITPAITGVSQKSAQGFILSPNPGNGQFTITLPDEEQTAIWIYNAVGSLVMQKQVSGANRTSIDISAFGKGIYTMQLRSRSGNHFSKVIIE